jgi:hypothetical protein
MARYNDDAPEATEDWPDERWTLSDPSGCDWSDEEQWARECLDCETFPVPDDGCDPPTYDDEAC